MATQLAADDRFDWRGPAVAARRASLFRWLVELFVPPKGHKVLPTASGMLLIFLGLTIGLAAYNTENNILFAALSLLISALILSGVVCWANLRCARWRLDAQGAFRVGEPGQVVVELQNARRRFPLFCVSFGMRCAAVEEPIRLYLRERLDPGERVRLRWDFKPERRMKAEVRIVDVGSTFPFGFLAKHIAGESACAVRVWPRRISYTRYRGHGVSGSWQGQSSQVKGFSGELLGLRHYERGDAPRSIHWKVSARQGRLIVKQNAAESQSVYGILVDPSRYLWADSEAFEKMCSLAASLAEDLFLEGKLDSCAIVGASTIKIQRVSDLECFFDALSELEPLDKSGLSGERRNGNRIVLQPLESRSVGAFVNGVLVAQA